MKHLAALLGALLLSLCAVSCTPQGEADLVVLITNGTIRKAAEAAVAEFHKEHPDVSVQIVTTPGKDYYVKSLAMLAGRARVDLLWLGQGFSSFSERGALLDLNPLMAADPGFSLKEYLPAVVNWYRTGSHLYGIPYGIDVQVIAYNEELFDAAKRPYPTADATIGELIDAARKLTDIDPQTGRTRVAGLGFVDLDSRYHGLRLLDLERGVFALNTPEARRWLEENIELIDRERVLQRGSDMESMDRLTAFLNQQVAMTSVTSWELAELRNRAPFRWNIAPIPYGIHGKRLGWASSGAFSISRDSRHPELAWQLLKHLTGPAFQRHLFEITIPSRPALYGEYRAASPRPPENLEALFVMLDHMDPNPGLAVYPEVVSEWNYWKERALLKKSTIPEALSEAERHINRILERHRKVYPGPSDNAREEVHP
ncbi:MAG TPA: sugar ABC transporter substrate-binding protein [Chthoniobacteraceae bacterium]|nr:sugar ABC transporter substrate-binding protein [Chthoniobacteraceae bacterium]